MVARVETKHKGASKIRISRQAWEIPVNFSVFLGRRDGLRDYFELVSAVLHPRRRACPVSSNQLCQTLHVVRRIHHANLDPGSREATGAHAMAIQFASRRQRYARLAPIAFRDVARGSHCSSWSHVRLHTFWQRLFSAESTGAAPAFMRAFSSLGLRCLGTVATWSPVIFTP